MTTLLPANHRSSGAALRWLAVASFTVCAWGAAHGQAGDASSAVLASASRWQSSLAEFAAADREKPPATGAALFVGSSTIRLWTSMAQDFRQEPVVINRGFGGSTMADCDHFARELVTRYQPRHVLVYAGDNDLAEGRSPEQILASFTHFVSVVRRELPQTRISYISIKPSPSRASLLPKIREANMLLAAYTRTLDNADYIDIFTPMLAADGAPRRELFGADMLHMNNAGYALWRSVIASQMEKLPAPAPGATLKAATQPAQQLSAAAN
ncbi:MAG: lipolytic protein family [Polaromonas sp.]|jgi:lysophospholipase L1-like esterase|nr:lipolytic protein family [Polaromonas sp.]